VFIIPKHGGHSKEESITGPASSKSGSPDKEFPQKGYDLHFQNYEMDPKSLEDV